MKLEMPRRCLLFGHETRHWSSFFGSRINILLHQLVQLDFYPFIAFLNLMSWKEELRKAERLDSCAGIEFLARTTRMDEPRTLSISGTPAPAPL